MRVAEELARAVRARAKGRCQFCQMHEALQGATFHIEHVIPRSMAGRTALENLVLACPSCNFHKSARTSAIDPITETVVSLFHPLQQRWPEHFQIIGTVINGITPTGRATAEALRFNTPRRQRIRETERSFDLCPPAAT
jgi:hypothetical protein